MKILLLGATGRTGGKVLAHLIDQGHEVTTLGRRAPEAAGANHLTGDLMERVTLASALERQDAAINCLQSPGSPPLCSTIAAILVEQCPGLRYVTVAGAAVDMPGDRKGFADRMVGGALKLLQREMLADRQREADVLRASTLRWTILRPPMLTDAAPTGKWKMTYDRPAKLKIARADLALAIVESLGRKDLEEKAPFISAA